MQGKYRIYFSYSLILIAGILLYLIVIFLWEYKDVFGYTYTENLKNKFLDSAPKSAPQTDENELTFEFINDNIEEIDKSIDKDSVQNLAINADSALEFETYIVASNIANIRENPTTKSNIFKRLQKGDKVDIIKIHNQNSNLWGELKEGGFVYMELLEINKSAKAYIVQADILNVREQPNLQAKIIKKIPQYQTIYIKNVAQDWGELADSGFVYMELVKPKE